MTAEDDLVIQQIKELLSEDRFLDALRIINAPRQFHSQLMFHLPIEFRKWGVDPSIASALLSGDAGAVEHEQFKFLERTRAGLESERLAVAKRQAVEEEVRQREELDRLAERKRKEFLGRLRKQFQSDFRGADSFFNAFNRQIISAQAYAKKKVEFVQEWVAANTFPDENGVMLRPDDEQASAIAAVNGHILVVARAGSGKTTMLVNRALFLTKHCRLAPHELLLLAFNRKAALEIRRKLLECLNHEAAAEIAADIAFRTREAGGRKGFSKDEVEANAVDAVAAKRGIALPHVMTFHALAHAIVHPEESLLYNGPDGQEQSLSKVVQQVIDDHLQIPAFKEKIRKLMLAHFREDWDRIIKGRHDQSKEEVLRFRRSLPRESLGGEPVKSYGEKVISDFLFENDIAYKYERNHWWNETVNGVKARTNYRPDFTIFKGSPKGKASGLIIEYFGLKGSADYDEMSERKREYWTDKEGWTLIEISPVDIAGRHLERVHEFLKRRLAENGISCVRLSEDEIWHRVKDRAIDRFTKATESFIGRCRSQSVSPADLQARLNSYSPLSSVEEMFLKLAPDLYDAYLIRLRHANQEDFNGLMQRAASAIEGGQTLFHRKNSSTGDIVALRYLCIDEFQDFSELFHQLLSAIRKRTPDVELFCVGDDWQAINGFAGSDLRFFAKFEDYIGQSRRLFISTNYRSSKSIVDVGNALMNGLGNPAVAHEKSPGAVLMSDLNDFEPSVIEKHRHPGDIITPAVLRLASKALAKGLEVVILNRTNRLNWYVEKLEAKSQDGFLESIRSHFSKELRGRINISTAHKYKGLEKPMVIVLDAVARSYPLIHPDWIFSRILGDTPEKITEEERRLLYVALTRAKGTLIVFTDGRNKSPFLEEVESIQPLNALNWAGYPPHQALFNSRLAVSISDQRDRRRDSGTHSVKEFISACRYQWHGVRKCWEKSYPVHGFSIGKLQAEVWAAQADGIDVRVFDGTDKLIAHYGVDVGRWKCIVDKLDRLVTPSQLGRAGINPA